MPATNIDMRSPPANRSPALSRVITVMILFGALGVLLALCGAH